MDKQQYPYDVAGRIAENVAAVLAEHGPQVDVATGAFPPGQDVAAHSLDRQVLAVMEGSGIVPYDLAAGYFCEECGRAVGNRILLGKDGGGCQTCADTVTRHRCTARPSLDDLDVGGSWECPDCGSTWTVTEEQDMCGECGRSGLIRAWSVVVGDCMDTAPKHEPYVVTPMRNLFRYPGQPRGDCYSLPSGGVVHVKPGCRC